MKKNPPNNGLTFADKQSSGPNRPSNNTRIANALVNNASADHNLKA